MLEPVIERLDEYHDPAVLYSALRHHPYSSFLDSAAREAELGRFSIVAFSPFMVIRTKGENIEVISDEGCENIRRNPLDFLKETLSSYRLKRRPGDIPFAGGCIGYFSYDLKSFIEELPSFAVDDMLMPDMVLCFYDIAVISDNIKKETYIASCGLPFLDRKKNRAHAFSRLGYAKEIVNKARVESRGVNLLPPLPDNDFYFDENALRSDFTKEAYFDAIKKAKEYIASGDIYQVNLSQRFERDFDDDPFELYMILRKINAAPFAAYLDLDDIKILSSSPERYIRIKDRHVETRPIKGTRPRAGDRSDDEMQKLKLLSSAKDRAEHIMIVDLERNDIGRICEYGSVRPSEFAALKSYATVHHLVSNVSGMLKPGIDIVDCLRACFPGGSITGAPKIRSMAIIEELEPVKRGVYTGVLGYIDFCGDADLSIVIRTIVLKDKKAYFQVGGGIVADSDPQEEYDETLDKGRALFRALALHEGLYKRQNI